MIYIINTSTSSVTSLIRKLIQPISFCGIKSKIISKGKEDGKKEVTNFLSDKQHITTCGGFWLSNPSAKSADMGANFPNLPIILV